MVQFLRENQEHSWNQRQSTSQVDLDLSSEQFVVVLIRNIYQFRWDNNPVLLKFAIFIAINSKLTNNFVNANFMILKRLKK